MSRCVTPTGRRASSTAFMAVGSAPVVPASPAPLTPKALFGEGTAPSRSTTSRSRSARHRVVHEARRQRLACIAMNELPLLRTPCVLHWDLNHFLVLRHMGRGCVTIHDPGVGVRRMSLAEAFSHFTGVALEVMPTSRFEIATRPPRVRMRALLGNLVGDLRQSSVLHESA